MATILTKKSDTASAVPLAADLTNAAGGAELAVNATDKRLFSKTSGGTVVELGTNPTAMAVVGNTTVGGTLGVTGATTLAGVSATTLSASSTVTLSGGTANGVAYLNGSKVVTSGSALTFDGTNFSATGTTTVNSANSTAVALVVKGETGNGIRQRFIGQASSGQYNWQIGASITAAGEFSFMPSTAVDGTTFTSSVYNITPTGVSYWSVGGSEGMRLTSTGLGIGTSSPSSRLTVSNSSGGNVASFTNTSSADLNINLTAGVTLLTPSTGTLAFGTSSTERARIDSSGNLLVNTTSTLSSAHQTIACTAGSGSKIPLALQVGVTTDGYTCVSFHNQAGAQGAISVNTSSVSYNTSSDYRLKNTIAPMTGALAKVALLKPCTYKWNADGSDGEGFIAHELAEVVPQCVTGEKDAVDEEGNPKYQGIDTSFLVATLTAALQEAVAEINQLKARLDAANL